MRMRTSIIVSVILSLAALAAAAKEKAVAKAAAPSGKAVAASLRAEWDVGELQMMRVAIDDVQYAPELKKSFSDAIDKFAQQQDALLAQVEADPSYEASARKKRTNQNAAFQEKMAAAYANPDFKKDMTRRMKALDKEIDAVAASAEKLM